MYTDSVRHTHICTYTLKEVNYVTGFSGDPRYSDHSSSYFSDNHTRYGLYQSSAGYRLHHLRTQKEDNNRQGKYPYPVL